MCVDTHVVLAYVEPWSLEIVNLVVNVEVLGAGNRKLHFLCIMGTNEFPDGISINAHTVGIRINAVIYGTAKHRDSVEAKHALGKTFVSTAMILDFQIARLAAFEATAWSTSSYQDRRVFLGCLYNAPVVLWIHRTYESGMYHEHSFMNMFGSSSVVLFSNVTF